MARISHSQVFRCQCVLLGEYTSPLLPHLEVLQYKRFRQQLQISGDVMSGPPMIHPRSKPSKIKLPTLMIPTATGPGAGAGAVCQAPRRIPEDQASILNRDLNPSPGDSRSGLSSEMLAAVGFNNQYSSAATSIQSVHTSFPHSSSTNQTSDSESAHSLDNSFGSQNSSQFSSHTTPSQFEHVSVTQLDEDGWAAVAKAGDIIDLGRLGEGAGGSVTRCRLRNGETVFALKEICTDPSPELQKQIRRELQFNRTCNSPHIVKYYGTFLKENSGSIFIAMEYCGGGSLDAIYKRVKARGGRIGEKVLGKFAESILSGLNYLHERKIIHRDIKPQNILLDEQGQVKLCDFGVSGEVVNSLATTFTGTSYYMAPERIQGQPYTVTSDVWSLGLTLMEVAQHRFPFIPEGEEEQPLMPIELLTTIVNMPAPELKDEPEEGIRWSDSFRHFLRCCLEKDPSKRASPRQMLNHPWIVGQRQKTVKMDKFVRECWS